MGKLKAGCWRGQLEAPQMFSLAPRRDRCPRAPVAAMLTPLGFGAGFSGCTLVGRSGVSEPRAALHVVALPVPSPLPNIRAGPIWVRVPPSRVRGARGQGVSAVRAPFPRFVWFSVGTYRGERACVVGQVHCVSAEHRGCRHPVARPERPRGRGVLAERLWCVRPRTVSCSMTAALASPGGLLVGGALDTSRTALVAHERPTGAGGAERPSRLGPNRVQTPIRAARASVRTQ